MSTIQIPDTLLQQIEAAGVPGGVEVFVQQAIRDKLASDQHREEFFRLSDEMRAAMLEQGLTEEQLLAEFDTRRRSS
jgi:hypothetical protein